ncbi:folylpolyglutamate synthase, mitochondrial-like isoform X2 [Tubulanus polymorphus]|uniref:folylpolyglutamate synthase, mitochondrial-like isoform X2 n=1 Tax=Tubulanus polymorphus TaxID=672921 RepID=UPI003DA68B92
MSKYMMETVRYISTQVYKKIDMAKNYEEAVRTLNTLQSNFAVLEKTRLGKDRERHKNIPETIEFCNRAGVTLNDIDQLSIIHVSGTKGKGSTCAFSESILRNHGYTTGFYSSPHLIEVRERIRINGRPLSKESFSRYFWDCYNKLIDSKLPEDEKMPSYFRFLTVMAFHVFSQEKVDVAIIEVGVGGEYDYTNVIRTPVVCGITSLGIDHVPILGDTIEKIAWQKAGIIKSGYPALTVPQPENGLDVIAERALEKSSSIKLVPHLSDYNWNGREPELGLEGDMQHWNASLAIQLSKTWLNRHHLGSDERKEFIDYSDYDAIRGADIVTADTMEITDNIYNGLKNCRWPGRNQILKHDKITYYLDGAHTDRSMSQCAKWFQLVADKEKQSLGGKVCRVLLFNLTGGRKPELFLDHLVNCDFDAAVFCPNVATLASDCADQTNYNTSAESQEARCSKNRNAWVGLNEQKTDPGLNPILTEIKPSVSDALKWITEVSSSGDNALRSCDHIQILITGSLHLVGCSLLLIDPEMNDRIW